MKRVMLFVLVFAVGAVIGGGFVNNRLAPKSDSPDAPDAEVIEFYRHETDNEPAVTETTRVLSRRRDDREEVLAEPRGGGRPIWTTRIHKGGKAVIYTSERVTVRP